MKALIIVDMQNGFLEENAPIFVPGGLSIIPKIKSILSMARDNSMQIVWTQVSIDRFRNTQYQELFPDHFDDNSTVLSKGSHNHEIHKDLKFLIDTEKDILVEKETYSAFMNTELENTLIDLNIKELFYCGVTTNVCVESSIRDSFQRGFYNFLIRDCTKTFSTEYQTLSEEIISFVFGKVIDSNNFINHIKS